MNIHLDPSGLLKLEQRLYRKYCAVLARGVWYNPRHVNRLVAIRNRITYISRRCENACRPIRAFNTRTRELHLGEPC